MITLQEILNLKTDIFKNSKRVKMVRHKDNRLEYRDVIKDRAKLLEYQKEQDKNIFKDCDYIISFIGQESTKSVFFGVFKVLGITKKSNKFHYNLIQLDEFNYFTNRIVIDWGGSALSWHQWYHLQKKEIIQIFPEGYLGEFPGLLNFVLSFDELHRLINNPDANQDWKNNLSSVNGIYLILDNKTGNQYIGSANGKKGIWQRWTDYATNYHGANKALEELCNKDISYHKNFSYSVLQTLPSNITKPEIDKIEALYKQKLGSKVHGLNRN